jgi:uncharacterized protein (TIGR00251 family)
MKLTEREGGVTFAVRVQPRAKRNAVLGELDGAVKIALTALPVEGQANEACIAFLAKLLGVSRAAVTLVSGGTRRIKIVRVAGVTAARVRAALAEGS